MFDLTIFHKPFLGAIWLNIAVEHPLICVDSKSLSQLYKTSHLLFSVDRYSIFLHYTKLAMLTLLPTFYSHIYNVFSLFAPADASTREIRNPVLF